MYVYISIKRIVILYYMNRVSIHLYTFRYHFELYVIHRPKIVSVVGDVTCVECSWSMVTGSHIYSRYTYIDNL